MAWMRDLDGFMPRWLTMGGWGGDPWHASSDKGGTTFLYPGAIFGTEGTYPSLRLKVLRNTMQMIEELLLAAKRGRGGKKALERRVNRLLGMDEQAWFTRRPAYVTKKSPKDWTGADFATEEPPIAGWKEFSPAAWRKLRRLAADLASR